MFNLTHKSLLITAVLLVHKLYNVHCYSCLMYISKTRKKIRPWDTSPPLAEMSLMLWIKHKLRKTSSLNKQIAFAEPNTCVWNCAPELIGGRLWCHTTGCCSWEIPQTGHAEFSAPCKGNCLTLGAGGMARNLRNQTGKQCCHLSWTTSAVRSQREGQGPEGSCL